MIVPKHKFLSKNARFVHNLLRERGFIKNSWKDSLVRIASNCFFPHCSSCSCTQSQQTPPRPISTADISSLCVLPACQSAQGAQKLVDKLNSGCQSDPSSGPSVPELPFSRPAPEDISLPGRGTPEESKREHWQPQVGPRSVRVPREGTQIPIQSRPEASLSHLRVVRWVDTEHSGSEARTSRTHKSRRNRSRSRARVSRPRCPTARRRSRSRSPYVPQNSMSRSPHIPRNSRSRSPHIPK